MRSTAWNTVNETRNVTPVGLQQRSYCDDKYRLTAALNAALQRITVLYSGLSVTPLEDYADVLDAVETARQHAERAQRALQSHVRQHGCS